MLCKFLTLASVNKFVELRLSLQKIIFANFEQVLKHYDCLKSQPVFLYPHHIDVSVFDM